MTENDLTLLRESGWSADVLTVLTHLGYQLDAYSPVTEVIEVSFGLHRFEVHRQETPRHIRQAIFDAGVRQHQKQTREAFQSLFTAAGMQLR